MEKADTFQEKFSPNHSTRNSEVNSILRTIKEQSIVPNKFYELPGTVQLLIKRLTNRKVPVKVSISNSALKNQPENVVLILTHILNSCLCTGYFPVS